MQGPKRIDHAEFALIDAELIARDEQPDGDDMTITGNHEDHGRVRLRRVDGVFTVEAESLEFVRPSGEAMQHS